MFSGFSTGNGEFSAFVGKAISLNFSSTGSHEYAFIALDVFGHFGRASIEQSELRLVERHEIEHQGRAQLIAIRPGASPRSNHALDATDQQGTLSGK